MTLSWKKLGNYSWKSVEDSSAGLLDNCECCNPFFVFIDVFSGIGLVRNVSKTLTDEKLLVEIDFVQDGGMFGKN